MAKLGIDYGTTNTVVVCSDRGRYPVVPHLSDSSVGVIARDVFPSIAVRDRNDGTLVFGADAERCLFRPGAEEKFDVIQSPKRWLRDFYDGGVVGTESVAGGFDPLILLKYFAESLRKSVLRSGLISADDQMDAVITCPANANGAQRYLTRRCFREAGINVVGAMNEPSAAAIEFADRLTHGNRIAARSLDTSIGVFDLGGGTFDVSIVRIQGDNFSVVDSAGIERLGGDDFDEVLARMFADRFKIGYDTLRPFQKTLLLARARQQKESISSGHVRTMSLSSQDIGIEGHVGTVSVSDYCDEIRRMMKPAMKLLVSLIEGKAAKAAGIGRNGLSAVYMVGGSSKLPVVSELVADALPDAKIVMTDKPFTATATGAAINSSEGVRLHEILSR
ncbi:MAG: hypothetical protein C0404_10415, partial [Verrucomicrobia bacterium]|nr:hypothetical protein [Verrucomicrobiota bacterium]